MATNATNQESSSSGTMALSQRQFDQLLSAVSASAEQAGTLDSKIDKLRDELRREQQLNAEKLAKKAKLDRPHAFKSKGNEEQHRFLDKALVELENTEVELEKAGPLVESISEPSSSSELSTTIKNVLAFVIEGKKLINQRQKLIRMADRSELRWMVVGEYEADELADDEEDEKRIAKAIKSAEKKAEGMKRRKRSRTGPAASYRGSKFAPANSVQAQPPMTRPYTPVQSATPYTRPIGPCFACHGYGHLRSGCTKFSASGRGPLYPFSSSMSGSMMGVEWCSCDSDREGWPLEFEAEASEVFEGLEPLNKLSCVKGRLRERYEYWNSVLHAPEPILSIVKEGYFLPLVHEPAPFYRPNHCSVNVHESFVTDAVSELLLQQCVRTVSGRPHICSPLLVVVNQNSGKKRLVISLRYLNLFLWKDKFKYEDIRTAIEYFEKDGYMCTFDLKSGYHHVDICEASQKYLGFQWKGVYYVFTVLPFGLASACYVFTKLLRPIVKYFRSQGHKLVIYVDDGILVGPDYQHAKQLCDLVMDALDRAGFVLNKEKSCLQPRQIARWLGFQIDLRQGSITIPDEKVLIVQQAIARLIMGPNQLHPIKCIASIVGKLISFSIAVGCVVRLRTRALYKVILSGDSWYSSVRLTQEALNELEFWHTNLEFFNGQPLWRSPSAVRLVYSDASDTGYAGYWVEHGVHVAQGLWTIEESELSSTWRELQAVALVLRSVATKLAHCNLRWFTDNQNVVRIIQVGSRKDHLQSIAIEIFKQCFLNSIKIDVEWIPRQENELADYYSRVVDWDVGV